MDIFNKNNKEMLELLGCPQIIKPNFELVYNFALGFLAGKGLEEEFNKAISKMPGMHSYVMYPKESVIK